MASRSVAEKWLGELTNLPTASGREDAVIEWVGAWVGRRPDLKLAEDSGGNLLINQKGRTRKAPVLAVAHMDHPGFVVTGVDDDEASFEFRGGVRPEYFDKARVEFMTEPGRVGRVTRYDSETRTGTIRFTGTPPDVGDIARWRLRSPRSQAGLFSAPACDDLAGCAAALAALDRARQRPELKHFGVLLTRAEEVGFIGALHAAKHRSIPQTARLISVETSRASGNAPVGEGPVIRVGDAASVFDADLTNLLSQAAAQDGLPHQRRLMSGGACEATAFVAYGYQATGVCLPLGNYHNMGDLDRVEAGKGKARPMMEEISLDDFHGLVSLLLVAAEAMDQEWDLPERIDGVFSERSHLLQPPPPR